MNNNSSKQILLSVLGVAILVVAVVGVSFAAFTATKTGTEVNEITTGTIDFEYTEESNEFTLENAMPMTDEQGKAQLTVGEQHFEFSVKSTISGKTKIKYSIAVQKVDVDEGTGESAESPKQLGDSFVSFYMAETATKGGAESSAGVLKTGYTTSTENSDTGCPSNVMEMIKGEFDTTDTKYYSLTMWVNDSYTVTGEYNQFKAKVNVYAKSALAS